MKKLEENVKAMALSTIMCLFTIAPVFAQENGNLSDAEIASTQCDRAKNCRLGFPFIKTRRFMENASHPKCRLLLYLTCYHEGQTESN